MDWWCQSGRHCPRWWYVLLLMLHILAIPYNDWGNFVAEKEILLNNLLQRFGLSLLLLLFYVVASRSDLAHGVDLDVFIEELTGRLLTASHARQHHTAAWLWRYGGLLLRRHMGFLSSVSHCRRGNFNWLIICLLLLEEELLMVGSCGLGGGGRWR